MPDLSYARKTAPSGIYADPAKGNPSLLEGVGSALPGRTWRCAASGGTVTLNIDGSALTQQEIDDLDAAHADWVPVNQRRYRAMIPVTTTAKNGRTQKIQWFQDDDGDGSYSGLAREEAWSWQGAKLVSITTTDYHTDGSVCAQKVEDYYTTSDGRQVRKDSDV